MISYNDFLKEANIKWYKEGDLHEDDTPVKQGDDEIIEVIEEHSCKIPITHVHNYGKHKGKTFTQKISTSGYRIQTNKNEYKFLICDEQDCCERWGYLSSDDDLQSYIGAKLLDISVVDKGLKITNLKLLKKIGNTDDYDDRGESTMFINLETSEGLLQFVAYNSHNGYYGHEVFYIINDNIEKQKRL